MTKGIHWHDDKATACGKRVPSKDVTGCVPKVTCPDCQDLIEERDAEVTKEAAKVVAYQKSGAVRTPKEGRPSMKTKTKSWKWKPSGGARDPSEYTAIVDDFTFRVWKNANGARSDAPEWGASCVGYTLTVLAYSMADAKRVCRIEYDRIITKGALP
jgi:hypothetical protein